MHASLLLSRLAACCTWISDGLGRPLGGGLVTAEGTLPAPQLVVTDGILQRLSSAESDAIVAHELAHIANGSLWFLYGIFPAACAVTTGLWPFFPWPFASAFGVALTSGLYRLIGLTAALALDNNNLPEAQRLIDRALELSPAESFLLVIQAEIAVQTGPVAEAQAIVTENLSRIRKNPLVFLNHDMARIEQAVVAKSAAESTLSAT